MANLGRPTERRRGRPATPSRTSQAVAVTRAGFARPHTPTGSADAQLSMCSGMRPIGSPSLRAHLAARTRFVDDQVLAAIAAGVTQVVVLGAGYDDRALRFHSPGVRFFELDHPATQVDKRRRVMMIQADTTDLTFAPVDFRTDQVGDVLQSAGHDPDRASLFVCEGLLVYLDEATIISLLAGLRARAAPDSALAASLAVHAATLDSAMVVRIANSRRPNGAAEPWRTILPAATHLDLLRRAGWSPTMAVDDTAMGTGALPERSLLVAATPG
jgi:methyltransferase (TIGR00027 family)